jgi:hypothetical protein
MSTLGAGRLYTFVRATIATKDALLTDEGAMRKTFFGMAGAAALAFTFNAVGADVGRSDETASPQELNGSARIIAHRGGVSATTEDRQDEGVKAVKPRDASRGEGSASGEPSREQTHSTSQEEFLRNVWSMP